MMTGLYILFITKLMTVLVIKLTNLERRYDQKHHNIGKIQPIFIVI